MPYNEDTYVYDPLDRQTFEAIAYNAIGRGSETNTYPAYRLTHSSGQSGWSVGFMQWDFGQRAVGTRFLNCSTVIRPRHRRASDSRPRKSRR